MNYWFLAASFAAIATFAFHTVVGGRFVARPLLAAEDVGKVARYTAYYCWHLVSILLAGLTLALLRAGLFSGGRELAAAAVTFSLCATVWSVAMIQRNNLGWVRFLQWMLFALIGFLGAAGLWF